MAQLSSPGVSVTVIDESFYTPAAPGTVPLIVVATAENKQNGAGTGTAGATVKSDAGNVRLLTSQKDLSDLFGTPVFKTDANNNPIHAGEQNEYGLQAAYSYLGVSNRAYVVRADIDLGQLDAQADAPAGEPEDGTYWFDTASTKFGIFEWNSAPATATGGQTFTNKVPVVITDTAKVDEGTSKPLASIGAVGDYAIVATGNLNQLYYKKQNTSTDANNVSWVAVGSDEWTAGWPTVSGTAAPGTLTADSIVVNTVTIANGGNVETLATNINTALSAQGVTAAKINGHLEIYSTGVDVVIAEGETGSTLAALGITAGTYKAPALQISKHTVVPEFKRSDIPGSVNGQATGSVWVKTTTPNLGADWVVKAYNASTKGWTEISAPLYESNAAALVGLDITGGGLNIPNKGLYVKYNDDEGTPVEANFKIYARNGTGATSITSAVISDQFTAGVNTFTIQSTVVGSTAYTPTIAATVSFTANGNAGDADLLLAALNSVTAGTSVVGSKTNDNKIVISHTKGGEIKFVDGTNAPLSVIFSTATTTNFKDDSKYVVDGLGDGVHFVATLWTATTASGNGFAPANADAPTTEPADGRLWYNSIVDDVDVMIHNGTTWVGYKNYLAATDDNGPQVSATAPTTQSDGVSLLVTGDLWIDTSDLENYPRIYKYNADLENRPVAKRWVLVDTTDQTTEEGVLFADARWNTNGLTANPSTIVELLTSNFLDTDAPDPALYPKGMLLWNLRRSGFNVKQFVRDYVDTTARNIRYNDEQMDAYYPHRWVSVAANQENGAGTFGRKAQRRVVIQALQATVNANQQIRDEESRIFNLLACPGYPELIGELVNLNYDRGLTAFVVGDTPARLSADATTLSNWGNNVNGAVEDGDNGLVSSDEYLGVFYPWGYTSDNLGNNVVVPPSHMILRTIALSDNVSYPWFAPAGTRRGGITNATAVGYVDADSGEFQSVALNNGQRDTLASIKVNPITFITGTGLVNYGQYTRAKNASALDRINVARLVIYLRRQFAQLAKPYVFEPNDKITRDEIKGAAENLLLELVGQRAIYDYVVVCDTSNNTPARIDRNELYLDVAIEPVKAVEFIYIPLRLKNTGEIKALGK